MPKKQGDICDTASAVSLLLFDSAGDLGALVRGGWVKPIGPDQWDVRTLVQGRIRALIEAGTFHPTVQMSGALGLSAARVRALTAEGVITQAANNKYNRDQTTRDFCAWQRDQNRVRNRASSEGRVRDARATEIEIRTAERARNLVTVEEALESNALVCGMVRTEFAGLAARVTRDLALRRDIEKAVNDSLVRIADRLIAEAANLEAGRDADEAVAADVAGPMGSSEPELSPVSRPAGTT